MKVARRFRALAMAAIAGAGAWLGACSDSAAPGIQPEIINTADNFEYQVSDVQGYTGTISYTWQNSGTSANVDQATVLTSGSVTLVILDGAGVQVYSRSLSENGSYTTAVGQTGSWTIRVVYSGADASVVNFRAQRP